MSSIINRLLIIIIHPFSLSGSLDQIQYLPDLQEEESLPLPHLFEWGGGEEEKGGWFFLLLCLKVLETKDD